jgi:hypothetical protein
MYSDGSALQRLSRDEFSPVMLNGRHLHTDSAQLAHQPG